LRRAHARATLPAMRTFILFVSLTLTLVACSKKDDAAALPATAITPAPSGKPAGEPTSPEVLRKFLPAVPAFAGAGWEWKEIKSDTGPGYVGWNLVNGPKYGISAYLQDCRGNDINVDEKSEYFNKLCVRPPAARWKGFPVELPDPKGSPAYNLRVGNIRVNLAPALENNKPVQSNAELEQYLASWDLAGLAKL
jgi:hypothetical protein